MATVDELQPLVTEPREDLAYEYKDWLDLTDNKDKAKLAKAAMALANHGGGTLLTTTFTFAVETVVPVEFAKKAREPSLLSTSDELPQGAVDGRLLRLLSANFQRLVEQLWVYCQVCRHIITLDTYSHIN